MQLTLWTYEGPTHVGAMRIATAMKGVHYVLHAPRREERELMDAALDRCLLAWPKLAAGDFAGAQQQLHGKAV